MKKFGCCSSGKAVGEHGWLSDICHGTIEDFVTPGGWRKLPGQPKQYTDGENSKWYSREEYMKMTEEMIGIRIDPEEALKEMQENTGKDFRLWK
jgi:hypothetical protein